MKPTLFLTERRRSECRLGSDDVDFLIAHHARHLPITPTRQPGVFLLTPRRLVGVVDAPGCRLVIRPKMPLRSFAFLLDPDAVGEDHAAVDVLRDRFGLLDFVVLRLAQLTRERLAAGLPRGYRQRSSEGPTLQGRLDVSAQARDPLRRDILHGIHDELSTDVLCNQVLRSTLEQLAVSSLLGEAVRPLLPPLLAVLAGITPVSLVPDVFALAARETPICAPLMELCRLAVEGSFATAGRREAGSAFLLDLERLFERHVGRGLREGMGSGVSVREQEAIPLPPLRLRADVVVRRGGEVRLVVDAKWKQSRPSSVRTADFYQALGYAVALGSPRVALVYPGPRDDSWTIPVPRAGLEVEVRMLRVTAGPNACRQSLAHLAEDLGCRL